MKKTRKSMLIGDEKIETVMLLAVIVNTVFLSFSLAVVIYLLSKHL